jgi:hypothetical protein
MTYLVLPAILAGASWVLIMYAFGMFPMFCAINTYKMTGVALTDYFTGSRHTHGNKCLVPVLDYFV